MDDQFSNLERFILRSVGLILLAIAAAKVIAAELGIHQWLR
jgi:hypothetical protein